MDAFLWSRSGELAVLVYAALFHGRRLDSLAVRPFLQQLMPKKEISEIYSSIGHFRHGKTYFYRTSTRHIRSTDDQFMVAPGIKGMVMTVFTLPSYEYVFKIIKDRFTPPKEVTHQIVKDKYHLVKRWDRAGRMADTQEFNNLVFDASRFSRNSWTSSTRPAPPKFV